MGWVDLLADEADPLRRPRTFKPEAAEQAAHQEPPSGTETTSHPRIHRENIFLLIGILVAGDGGWGGLEASIQQNSFPKLMTLRTTVTLLPLPTLTRKRVEHPKTSPGKNTLSWFFGEPCPSSQHRSPDGTNTVDWLSNPLRPTPAPHEETKMPEAK